MEFDEAGAIVFGMSPDSVVSHDHFCTKHDLGVTLLSDADKTVMRAYAAYGPKKLYGNLRDGVIRSTVLIDPQGNVAHRWGSVRPPGHAAAVLERLRELSG